MGLFRRNKEDETLNEQLLHDAGLDEPEEHETPDEHDAPAPVDPLAGTYPADDAPAAWLRAMARPGQYDAVVTIDVPGIEGDSVAFATLPDGDVIVDSEQGDADLSPFADAVEEHVKAPYRVIARRQDGDTWSVAARGIDVIEVDFDGGDEIELSSVDGEIDLKVDGEPWDGRIPELEGAGEAARGEDYVVQAERLDGSSWEVRASPL